MQVGTRGSHTSRKTQKYIKPHFRPGFANLQAICPSRLVFVLRDGDQWIHNRGGDFSADLKPTSIEGKPGLESCMLCATGKHIATTAGVV